MLINYSLRKWRGSRNGGTAMESGRQALQKPGRIYGSTERQAAH